MLFLFAACGCFATSGQFSETKNRQAIKSFVLKS
jgi:hypothetical protein